MGFSIVVIDHGMNRKLDTCAELASDLDAPLRKFGAHLRRKAIAKYKSQNFAPLAASTIEKRAQKGIRSMGKKLALAAQKAVGTQGGLQGVLGALSKTAGRRVAVLAEFHKMHRRKLSLRAQANGVTLSLSQQVSLAKRTVRAVQKAIDRPILGTLPATLETDVERGTVTLRSHTRQPFTDTHNVGGSAGHGAREPERKTLEIEDSDIAVLTELLIEHALLPFA